VLLKSNGSLSVNSVSQMTGAHNATLAKLVEEGFLPSPLLGPDVVLARMFHELGSRASRETAERDRRAGRMIRERIVAGLVRPSTRVVLLPGESRVVDKQHELLEVLDTHEGEPAKVLPVGRWLEEYRRVVPSEAFAACRALPGQAGAQGDRMSA
jgi:hypothetical protein